ncbi:hypothetical protein HK104_002319 [Borealophlyctis nickersoniae]|nr:hypothetical protein HK104_002319 [Borealophlyctis nickersoniae]
MRASLADVPEARTAEDHRAQRTITRRQRGRRAEFDEDVQMGDSVAFDAEESARKAPRRTRLTVPPDEAPADATIARRLRQTLARMNRPGMTPVAGDGDHNAENDLSSNELESRRTRKMGAVTVSRKKATKLAANTKNPSMRSVRTETPQQDEPKGQPMSLDDLAPAPPKTKSAGSTPFSRAKSRKAEVTPARTIVTRRMAKTLSERTIITTLNADAIGLVFHWLDPTSLCRCERACRVWNRLHSPLGDSAWRLIVRGVSPRKDVLPKKLPDEKCWKSVFRKYVEVNTNWADLLTCPNYKTRSARPKVYKPTSAVSTIPQNSSIVGAVLGYGPHYGTCVPSVGATGLVGVGIALPDPRLAQVSIVDPKSGQVSPHGEPHTLVHFRENPSPGQWLVANASHGKLQLFGYSNISIAVPRHTFTLPDGLFALCGDMLLSFPAPSEPYDGARPMFHLYLLPTMEASPNTPPSKLWTKEAPKQSGFTYDISLNDLVAVIFLDRTEPTPTEIHLYSVENGAHIRQIDVFTLGHRRWEQIIVSRFHIHLLEQWPMIPDQEPRFQQYTCINIADPRQRYTVDLGDYLRARCSMHLSCGETAVMFATGFDTRLRYLHCMDLRGRKFSSHEKADVGSASPCGSWLVWREEGSNQGEVGWYKMPYSEKDLGWEGVGSAEDREDV